jgi:hypothetical protein
MRVIKVICGFGKPEYFFKRDWTGRNSLIPFRKLDFTRNSEERATAKNSIGRAFGNGHHMGTALLRV